MQPRSSYEELSPPPPLRGALACLWIRTIGADDRQPVRVVPDGCVDLIWQTGHEPLLAGPDTGPNLVVAAPGTVIVGARFRPGAGGPALGIPLGPIRDQRPELRSLDPALAEQLDPGLPAGEALRRLTRIAARMIRAGRPDAAVGAAARALSTPGARVRWLADELGFSERQLRRRFEAAVGYGPKTLQRVLRFQHFLARIDAPGPAPDLAEVAFEAGYADQAHLTRECVELAGLPPAALARSRRAPSTPGPGT